MSATAFQKGNPSSIIPIHSNQAPPQPSSPYDPALNTKPLTEPYLPDSRSLPPSLPGVSHELERYFAAAKQIEAAFNHEQVLNRRYQDEIRDLQIQYSRLAQESDTRIRDQLVREERLKSQLSTQAMTFQQSEKILQNQLSDLSRQVEKLRDERNKADLEVELTKANLDYMKQREETLTISIQNLKNNEKAQTETLTKLTQQIKELTSQVDRYKASWQQVSELEKKAKAVIEENPNLKQTIEELRESVKAEKQKSEQIQEVLTKERREKRIALSCLHTAEAKITQLSWELENMKKNYEKSIDGSVFELTL
ncbi:MAG: hypothetical protein ACO3A2_07235 [Bdellovibrionia bacterium]